MKKETKMVCEHLLDKNHTHCVRCGMKVIKNTFRVATKEEQEMWNKNPEQFLTTKE